MDNAGLNYDVRDYFSEDMHCGGWVDYGNPAEMKHSLEEAERLYSKCACPQKLKFSFACVDGIMTPCDPVHNRMELGLGVEKREYIDLFDNALNVEEQRAKVMAIYHAKVLPTCAYCNGMCDDSGRYRPGEQLTKDEVRKIRENDSKEGSV